jgi:hypothetical protein
MNAAIEDTKNPGVAMTGPSGDPQPPIGYFTSTCPNAMVPAPQGAVSPRPGP